MLSSVFSSFVWASSGKVLPLNLEWVGPFHYVRKAVGFRTPRGRWPREIWIWMLQTLGGEQHFNFGKSISLGLYFVILQCVVLQLFAMQRVLCTDTVCLDWHSVKVKDLFGCLKTNLWGLFKSSSKTCWLICSPVPKSSFSFDWCNNCPRSCLLFYLYVVIAFKINNMFWE